MAAAREAHIHFIAAGHYATEVFGVQALVNLCVAMAILPTKGLTLPLLSFGGSGIVAKQMLDDASTKAKTSAADLRILREGTRKEDIAAARAHCANQPWVELRHGDAMRVRDWPAEDFARALAWDVDIKGLVSGEANVKGRRSAPEGTVHVTSAQGRYYGVAFADLDVLATAEA